MPDARELLDEGLLYEKGGVFERALDCYRQALDVASDAANISEALRLQSHVYRGRSEWDGATETARRSAEVAREAGLDDALAEALNAEAAVHLARGDFDAARPLLEEMLAVTKDERIRGVALQNLGTVAARHGELSTAADRFRESGECFGRAGYAWGEAFALANSAAIALDRAQFEEAVGTAVRAERAAKRLGDLELLALSMMNRAEALAALGQYEDSEELVSTALGYFTSAGKHWRRVVCMRLLGDFNRERDRSDTARRFYGSALNLATEIGASREAEMLRDRLDRLGES